MGKANELAPRKVRSLSLRDTNGLAVVMIALVASFAASGLTEANYREQAAKVEAKTVSASQPTSSHCPISGHQYSERKS